LIVIDGKSKDDTVEIINNNRSLITYFISEPDNGIYDAMNKGIKAAKGNWLLFLGADDILKEGILSAIFTNETFINTQLIYGKVNILGTNKSLGRETNYLKLIENNIPHQGIFYHKSIFDSINGYNTQYKVLADYFLNLTIFEHELYTTTFIDKVIVIFNAKGLSNRTIDFQFFYTQLNYFIEIKRINKKDPILAKYYFFIGVGFILSKAYKKGINNLLHSVLYSNNKVFYTLLIIDFLLSKLRLRKNYTLA
jgi:glycosyltransferase involved in cell wall biosynthesis